MCRVLQGAAENLVQDHRLDQDDDLTAVSLSLGSLLKEDNIGMVEQAHQE
jgi:hypothetical protein